MFLFLGNRDYGKNIRKTLASQMIVPEYVSVAYKSLPVKIELVIGRKRLLLSPQIKYQISNSSTSKLSFVQENKVR